MTNNSNNYQRWQKSPTLNTAMAIASVCFVTSLTLPIWAQGSHREQFARVLPVLCAGRTKRWRGGWPRVFSRRICFIPASTTYSLWDLSDSAGPRFLTLQSETRSPYPLSSHFAEVCTKLPAEKWVFVAFVDGCEQSATDICLILPVIAS